MGNGVGQTNSYNETLIQCRGRFFRIRGDESPTAPPSGDNAMTSTPANKKNLIISEMVYDKRIITIIVKKLVGL